MGEFRRQPSKVWWLNFPNENDFQISHFPDWGEGVDTSANMSNATGNSIFGGKDESVSVNNILDFKDRILKNSPHEELATVPNNEETEWQERKSDNWQNSDVSSDRGCSSSASQGSHKSQDSGFSDSEIHTNVILHSPQDSPELPKRAECSKCEETNAGTGAADDCSSSLVNGLKNMQISKGSHLYSPCRKNYLETAFDGSEQNVISKNRNAKSNSQKFKSCTSYASGHGIFTKIQKARAKNSDKIDKIQNQLELSFKLSSPKRTTLTQSVSKLVATQLQVKQPQICTDSDKDNKELVQNDSSNHTVIKLPKKGDKVTSKKAESDLDSQGFRKPKVLAEQNFNYKGSDNFLNLSHIEDPPISSSTPKLMKFKRQESPTPKAARATEKIGSTSTFATIRKLKGISEKKIKRPAALFSGFNRIRAKENPQRNSNVFEVYKSPIKQWLSELSTTYQAEIMTTLQSKSLATDLTRQVTNMAAATSETVRKLHEKTRVISAEFSRLFKHNNEELESIEPLVISLIGHTRDFLDHFIQSQALLPQSGDHNANQRKVEMVTDFRQEEPRTKEITRETDSGSVVGEVMQACADLKKAMEDNFIGGEGISKNLEALGKKFTEVVDIILLTHVKAFVRALEEPKTELTLYTALSALTSLDLEGNVLSHLVARTEGVRALLAVCLEGRAIAVRLMALRVLTIVCCASETIKQFEQAGGLEIISDILADEKRSEVELSETVAVLAQITAPWIKENNSLTSLSHFLAVLVRSVTRIVKVFRSSEILLLSAAALANLTFMEPRTVWPLIENQTAEILLTAVRQQGPKVSVFIQEQAATVIANMASVPECRKHLADIRAVAALLCFLQIRHSPFQRVPEIEAAERVQQKSAVALSRLCTDSTVATQVVELQGVARLVRLCKEERERNHSDAVLVACLAALRKIQANCGSGVLDEFGALELVEPRLLDSFLLYSSKQESYV